MEAWQREYYVSRIVSGRIRLIVNGTVLFYMQPSRDQRAYAGEVYRAALQEAQLDGVIFQDELNQFMLDRKLWSPHEQEQLDLLAKTLDDMKAELYEAIGQSSKRLTIRTALKKGKNELDRLYNKKHALDYITCEGIAISAKYRYLMGCSLYYQNGIPYWGGEEADDAREDPFIDKATEILANERLTETQFRELALNDPWRSIWGARNLAGRGLFDVAASDMTDDQRAITLWSGIFDSIRESPHCPPDEVFSDDDMLDGWMIIHRRKRDKQVKNNRMQDKMSNEKVRNSDEVFIMVDNVEEAREVEELNDTAGKMIKQQRAAALKQAGGELSEMKMPDTWQRFQTEAAQYAASKIKG